MGAVGMAPDQVSSLLPQNAWSRLFNVQTSAGSIRSSQGERKLFDLSIKPRYHTAYQAPNGRTYVIVSDGANIIAYDVLSQIPADILPAAGIWSSGAVTFTNLNGILVVNSESDGPFYWDVPAALPADQILVPLPGWDSKWRCKAMIAFRYYLVAMNMTEDSKNYMHKLRWSNSAQEGDLPTQWVASLTNDAGDDLLGETAGGIIGGAIVRDVLMVLKTDAVYSMSWIGGQYVMRVDRLKDGVGTRVPQGFAGGIGGLFVFTSSDVLLFDGQNSNSIAAGRVKNAIFTNVSEDLWEFSQVFMFGNGNVVMIGIVGAGSTRLTDAYVYNYVENTWGHKALAFGYGFDQALVTISADMPTWDELGEPNPLNPPMQRMIPGLTWDQQRGGSWNKGVYQPSVPDLLVYESNDTDTAWWVSVVALEDTNSSGSAKYCMAERLGIPAEGADGMAMVTEVWPEIVGDIPVRISIGGQLSENSAPIWDGPHDFIPGVTNSITPRVTGRFICIRVESQSKGRWVLGALTYDWQRCGDR